MELWCIALVVMFSGYGNSLEMVPIVEWGGSELKYQRKLANPVPLAIIHHTVSPECDSDQGCLHQLNNIRNYYLTEVFGSGGDIPYSFIIGGNGKVYEGAGWHNVGAHTFGYNNQSFGIGFLGDFRTKSPTPKALEAAQELLSYGFENKYLSNDYKLVGALQLSHTASPGAALQKIIEDWPHWTPILVTSLGQEKLNI